MHSYNLSVNGDVEKDEENEGEDTVDEEVEVDEIQLDIQGIDSKRSRSNIFYLKLAILKMQKEIKHKLTRVTLLQSVNASSRGASSHKVWFFRVRLV